MTLLGTLSHPVAKRLKSRKGIVLLFLVLLAFASGCSYGGPPPADTPEPPVHNGVFRSEVGTLTFYGDGERVTVCFEDSFAAEAGFPIGKWEGTYVFQFQNGAYRYDKAEVFRIFIGDIELRFQNNFQETNENLISLTSPVAANETLHFLKIEDQS